MKRHLTHFVRLVNFEFGRTYKFLLGIMSVVVVFNLIGFISIPLAYMNDANTLMRLNNWTEQQYLENFSIFSNHNVMVSNWLFLPIAIGAASLLLFSVFIWYREWFSRSSFIYRLLMLPCSRMNIFFSKLFAIMLSVLSLVSVQIVTIFVGSRITPMIVSEGLMKEVSLFDLIEASNLYFIIPKTGLDFFMTYFYGLVFLIVLFTGILFERSYKLRGVIFGGLFYLTSIIFVASPSFIPYIFNNRYLVFESELLLLHSLASVIIGIIALFTSSYLLKHKITV